MDDSTTPPNLPGPIPAGASDQPSALTPPPPLSPLAVTSLVLGLIPCLGIAGLICGIVALVRIRRRPTEMRGDGLAIAGIAVSTVTGVLMLPCLAGMLLPALAKAKGKAQQIQCSNNLRQIGLAVRIYNTDSEGKFPANFQAVTQELGTPKILVCPADHQHSVAETWAAFSDANVSYRYLGRGLTNEDATVVIAMCTNHMGGAANVLFGDGSVQFLTAQRLRSELETKDGRLYLKTDR